MFRILLDSNPFKVLSQPGAFRANRILALLVFLFLFRLPYAFHPLLAVLVRLTTHEMRLLFQLDEKGIYVRAFLDSLDFLDIVDEDATGRRESFSIFFSQEVAEEIIEQNEVPNLKKE